MSESDALEMKAREMLARAYREAGKVIAANRVEHAAVSDLIYYDRIAIRAIVAALEQQPAGCETFNIAMDEPFDYGHAAAHIKRRFGQDAVEVRTPFHSVWLDNTKARQKLLWRPRFDTEALIDTAWSISRKNNAKRQIVYPG